MFVYSRNYLLSLKFWWKCSGPVFQTSSHIQQQSTRPVLPSVWDAIKAVGLLRKTRGKRAGRYFNNCYRIKSILPTYRDDRAQSNSVIKFAGANRRLVDNTMIGNNNITIRRQPLLPPPSSFKPMFFTVLNSRSIRNKALPVKDLIVDYDIDILALTETWLSKESDEYIIRDISPTEYEFYNSGNVDMHNRPFIPVRIAQRAKRKTRENTRNLNNLISIKRQAMVSSSRKSCVEKLKFGLINARSINNKTELIKDIVSDNEIDVLAVTETWLRAGEDNDFVMRDICPYGFIFTHIPRSTGSCGGVGLLYKNSLKLEQLNSSVFKTF